jgi:plastocyanin
MTTSTRRVGIAALALAAVVVGCSGEGKREGGEARERDGSRDRGSEGAREGHGKVVVVEAYSDEKGNYFKPADFEVHRGDTIRFTLKSGVHNVHFLPDSNPGKSGLPPASDMLQIPDQTWDLPITLAEGRYFFQCDPHVALGMKGHVKVED